MKQCHLAWVLALLFPLLTACGSDSDGSSSMSSSTTSSSATTESNSSSETSSGAAESSSPSPSESSSSESSSVSPEPLELVLTLEQTGATVWVDARESIGAQGNRHRVTLDFGDGSAPLIYPFGTHTYAEVGNYTLTVILEDLGPGPGTNEVYDSDTLVNNIVVTEVTSNRPPLAHAKRDIYQGQWEWDASESTDPDDDDLTYSWSDANETAAVFYTPWPGCPASNSSSSSAAISSQASIGLNFLMPQTVTVSDGELTNTANVDLDFYMERGLVAMPTSCNDSDYRDWAGDPFFTYEVDGLTVHFDASRSIATGLLWYPGDGSSATGWTYSHTYTQPGTYSVQLHATGNFFTGIETTEINVGANE